VSMSGAAMLRKQTSGTLTTSNPRRMFDESQMVRRVRAYLASIKSKLIADEAHLSEMSAQCEAPAQHTAQQPGMYCTPAQWSGVILAYCQCLKL